MAKHPGTFAPLAELFTAPAAHILDRWFESDVLKATLATDSVIGALVSPYTPGSGYVLLHHVMGEAAGRPGVWAYVRSGMGALSSAVAASAAEAGAVLRTRAECSGLLLDADGAVAGVRLVGGEELRARTVLATCTPHRLFNELLPAASLPVDFARHIAAADYSCGAFKINLALSRLPRYAAEPAAAGEVTHAHRGTAHFEASMGEIHNAYLDAAAGRPSATPVVEMTLPSALDDSLAPPGCHVAGLFVQYAPYALAGGRSWDDPGVKEAFAESAFAVVERHAPGFRDSILHADLLSPLDLERTFGLHRGNIFHGALGLHQLAYNRPAPGYSSACRAPDGSPLLTHAPRPSHAGARAVPRGRGGAPWRGGERGAGPKCRGCGALGHGPRHMVVAVGEASCLFLHGSEMRRAIAVLELELELY